ncbi:MAG TPA: hypothetical protein VJ397_04855 [Thermoplasmata archaeon]|nr:hypothetical protein [Thermoplasmata archaeon]
MVIRVNWSEKRQRHVLDRMLLRGISRNEFMEALIRGRKRRQRDAVYESAYRYFTVVYQERDDPAGRWRKVFPITVKVGP